MPDIDGDLFRGSGSISTQDAANCEVNNIGDAVTAVLADYGWNGEPAGCILLQLSADNERVAAGSFLARGSEEKEFVLDTSKIWQDANMGITLMVRQPELDSFAFNDGGLTSDFLTDEEMVHFFHATLGGGSGETHPDGGPSRPGHRQVLHPAGLSAVQGVYAREGRGDPCPDRLK